MDSLIWPAFDDWWNAYDYKLDRKRCMKLWAKMSQKDRELAISHTERYVASTFTDGRFPSRRHPGTYLHNENWHDDALIRPTTPAVQQPEQIAFDAAEAIARRIATRREANNY